MYRASSFLILLLSLFVKVLSQVQTGNVIFIHPDGTSLSDWNALRIVTAGPDSEINWDKLSAIGLYQGHIKNNITASSNAGATIHAYGVKADFDDFGMIDNQIPISMSGKRLSVMKEAMMKGIRTGLINSGSIIEPGTAVFVSSNEKRSNYEAIAKDVIQSGVDLIFSGGEEWLLPVGVKGKFCEGKRTDGLNLIEWANQHGYKIVYTRDELRSCSYDDEKILGVFAAGSTFNDRTEEELIKRGLNNYLDSAPRLDEMTKFALEFLSNKGQFFLVVEEEATDNFANKNNATGKLEGLLNSDKAIGEVLNFIESNPKTMLITASDSEAGGMGIMGYKLDDLSNGKTLPLTDNNGSPIDGIKGTGTSPFYSKPDKNGNSFPFGIVWASYNDLTGSLVARCHGLNSERMKGKIDNTEIYRIIYCTLFGIWLTK